MPQRFLKSDLIDYNNCKKSAWLKRNDHEVVNWPKQTAFEQILAMDGYVAEDLAQNMLSSLFPNDTLKFQFEFNDENGHFTRSDIVRFLSEQEIEIYEVKASSSLKKNGNTDPIVDACFQAFVAEHAGYTVSKIAVILVNKNFIKKAVFAPSDVLVIEDITEKFHETRNNIETNLSEMREYLARENIDRDGCECIQKPSASNHCDSFDYFNPDIPEGSIFLLPGLRSKKHNELMDSGFMKLKDVPSDELSSSRHKKIRDAAESETPQVNLDKIRSFIDDMSWPIHFYDYETVRSIIPILNGAKPSNQIPTQYSLHILQKNGSLEHFEFLSENLGQQIDLIEHMKKSFKATGSVVSWNKPFENGCNETLASIYPEHAKFLNDITFRTVDLMDVFKEDYVDIRFGGSISIKKVLPVLCPHISYNEDAIHEGAGAMAAWLNFVNLQDINEKNRIRSELKDYCELDSLAMVEIFKFLSNL